MRHDPRPDIDTLPDIPGTRNRWRCWYSVVLDGSARITVEEMHGHAYIDTTQPPIITIDS